MAVVWLKGSCPPIPEITDEKLAELSAKIKPLVASATGELLYEIEEVDPRRASFIWDPKIKGQFVHGIYECARIETYHETGYGAIFKPSVAEVLAQIPPHLHNAVDYFQTLRDDTVAVFSEHDGYRTVTVLYTKSELGSNEWWDRVRNES